MSSETSFQIKSLIPEHKCARNYNLGALVTFRWVALHFFKDIIEDPFISLRKMRVEAKKKFMLDVSVGQCRRAKQLALFNHEGGLKEHHVSLYHPFSVNQTSLSNKACMHHSLFSNATSFKHFVEHFTLIVQKHFNSVLNQLIIHRLQTNQLTLHNQLLNQKAYVAG